MATHTRTPRQTTPSSGWIAKKLRNELDVYTKAQLCSLLTSKANADHTHALRLYSGRAGYPPHEHFVQGPLDFEKILHYIGNESDEAVPMCNTNCAPRCRV